jgi:hypothetical protein
MPRVVKVINRNVVGLVLGCTLHGVLTLQYMVKYGEEDGPIFSRSYDRRALQTPTGRMVFARCDRPSGRQGGKPVVSDGPQTTGPG